MQSPLVTIICVCYNHEKYVAEAIESVLLQTYANIQLIVVDDASSDGSCRVIEDVLDGVRVSSLTEKTKSSSFKLQNEPIFIRNDQNLGNCVSFNIGLAKARGKYIIDLSADDVLLDDRVEKQVAAFEKLGEEYAVVFTNALNINEAGAVQGYHYVVDQAGKSKVEVPQGNVYQEVLKHYFICTPTMMMRTQIVKEMGGYDETLSYEDFDFWVRTARHHLYYYLDEVSTMKRSVRNSLSSKFYRKNYLSHLESTLKVCYKALAQNTSQEENASLAHQTYYFLRLAFYMQHFDLVKGYYQLLQKLDYTPRLAQVLVFLSRYRIKVYGLYRLYTKVRRWGQVRLR
ncbi:MAG TPA: glycosyl transferase family 2 [Microscillaceae bacterium]|nr:glycosyl transferase family 2 [Microscillaceae bacterium]